MPRHPVKIEKIISKLREAEVLQGHNRGSPRRDLGSGTLQTRGHISGHLLPLVRSFLDAGKNGLTKDTKRVIFLEHPDAVKNSCY